MKNKRKKVCECDVSARAFWLTAAVASRLRATQADAQHVQLSWAVVFSSCSRQRYQVCSGGGQKWG